MLRLLGCILGAMFALMMFLPIPPGDGIFKGVYVALNAVVLLVPSLACFHYAKKNDAKRLAAAIMHAQVSK